MVQSHISRSSPLHRSTRRSASWTWSKEWRPTLNRIFRESSRRRDSSSRRAATIIAALLLNMWDFLGFWLILINIPVDVHCAGRHLLVGERRHGWGRLKKILCILRFHLFCLWLRVLVAVLGSLVNEVIFLTFCHFSAVDSRFSLWYFFLNHDFSK